MQREHFVQRHRVMSDLGVFREWEGLVEEGLVLPSPPMPCRLHLQMPRARIVLRLWGWRQRAQTLFPQGVCASVGIVQISWQEQTTPRCLRHQIL